MKFILICGFVILNLKFASSQIRADIPARSQIDYNSINNALQIRQAQYDRNYNQAMNLVYQIYATYNSKSKVKNLSSGQINYFRTFDEFIQKGKYGDLSINQVHGNLMNYLYKIYFEIDSW